MFERYSESARRVVFFARYEASMYGSEVIEPEHLLLGLTREDDALVRSLSAESNLGERIRADVESHITCRERISTSVEVPVSTAAKKVLQRAVAAADNLEHRVITTEHLLIGLLQEDDTLAAKILRSHGVKLESLTERLAKIPATETAENTGRVVEAFLSGLQRSEAGELLALFADNATVIDADGKHWTGTELKSGFESLFAPYAKRNAIYHIETKAPGGLNIRTFSVVWKNALLASEQRAWNHRMLVVVQFAEQQWQILMVRMTAIDSAHAQDSVKRR